VFELRDQPIVFGQPTESLSVMHQSVVTAIERRDDSGDHLSLVALEG
jgi:hypothetical protein